MKKFDAVAFDVDGTLYPNHRAVVPLGLCAVRELPLVFAFQKARRIIRAEPEIEGSFFEAQAAVIARILGKDRGDVKKKIEETIYRDWCAAFKKVRPFAGVRNTLEFIRGRGYKTAAMSDFPPHEKLGMLGLDGLWDYELGSEFTGRLKPDAAPFLKLSSALKVPPERILYVGNSVRYDVIGSKKTGMKAALIEPFPRFRDKGGADFVFRNYAQLKDYISRSEEES